ncbi:uncharacterized protein LOC111469162 isoform X2 [Cucurbita maxima]|uniref:Uncharacterized protein LOC111469162 isoform X2 n=1 Tax=Cucurbita maxima TaxID=3661 RepID=A0A6J1I4U9_CUCMA|nr:uncharacterized protein LOC111469162 isoform X2 [Cucurbita maxima]
MSCNACKFCTALGALVSIMILYVLVGDAIMELLFCCSNKSGVCSTAPLPSLFCLWKVCIETGPSLCVGRQSCWSKELPVLPAIIVLNLPFAPSVMSFLILHVSLVAVNTTRVERLEYTSPNRRRHDFKLADSLSGESKCRITACKHLVRVRLLPQAYEKKTTKKMAPWPWSPKNFELVSSSQLTGLFLADIRLFTY